MILYHNQDVYVLLNALAKQVLGADTPTIVDTITLSDVGAQLSGMPKDTIIQGLSYVIGETIIGVRQYSAKFTLIQDEGMPFADLTRKISYYSNAAIESKFDNFSNTDEDFIGTGKSGSYADVYEQDLPHIVELDYCMKNSWTFKITFLENQLDGAFESPEAFMKFWNGHIANVMNDQEFTKENYNRQTVLEFIAATCETNNKPVLGAGANSEVARKGSVVNLVSVYNGTYGAAESTSTILEDPVKFKQLMQLYTAEVKRVSDLMTNRTTYFHVNPYGVGGTAGSLNEKKKLLPRHTPKANQKMFMYAPLYRRAEASVMSEIFNPQYLDIKNTELVEFWQSPESPSEIHIEAPTLTTTVDLKGEPVLTAGHTPTAIDYVVAVLFDDEACKTGFKYQSAATSPLDPVRLTRNTFYHNVKASKLDLTENAVVFVLSDDPELN